MLINVEAMDYPIPVLSGLTSMFITNDRMARSRALSVIQTHLLTAYLFANPSNAINLAQQSRAYSSQNFT